MDVEDEETVREASLKVKELSPGLDAVISNAGILCPSDRVNLVTSLDIGDLAAMLSVNTLGAARVIRYFDPLMRDGGVFATITSEAGEISNPFPELPGYCVSKAAANKLVSIQRVTVSRYHVFAIHPGRVDTDMGRVSAQITPMESARGICDIVTGKKPIPQEAGWFINYRGESMPI
jgi:NAD(P)-dependent dehydrogenase (short-subunit alcohol dehydrogenase family)